MVRRPSRKARIKKFLWIVLPAVSVLAVGILVFMVLTVYRVTHPPQTPETVNPSNYLLPSVDVSWTSIDGTEISGWWIPSKKSAPGIILSPGYGMDRSDVLSMAFMLKENGLNLLIYSQRGCGRNPKGSSSLGLREDDDLLTALDLVISRPDVDATRIGIWGVDIGARSALKAAATRPQVRAIVADSPYDKVTDFLAVKLREEMGLESRLLAFICRQGFRLYFLEGRASMIEPLNLDALRDRSILFVQGQNRKEMSDLTSALYARIQPQKELVSLPSSKTRVMSSEDAETYNRQVANFFVLNLSGTPAKS